MTTLMNSAENNTPISGQVQDLNADTSTFFPDTDAVTGVTAGQSRSISPSTSDPPASADNTHSVTDENATVKIVLTHSPLCIDSATKHTRSPTAGATVLFLGTTRSYFQDPSRPVSRLSYTSYPALALRTLISLARTVQTKHDLERVYVAHRLGEVAVAEESIVVAVSSAHRGPAWSGAEELLELVKERAEIWKREWFVDGVVEEGRDGKPGVEVGVWRDNRESDRMGQRKDQCRG